MGPYNDTAKGPGLDLLPKGDTVFVRHVFQTNIKGTEIINICEHMYLIVSQPLHLSFYILKVSVTLTISKYHYSHE